MTLPIGWRDDDSSFDPLLAKGKTVLVAGTGGNGSFAADALVRLGFRKLILADPDTVESRNISRQDYERADVGVWKVTALARRLSAIDPNCELEVHNEGLTADNCIALSSAADIVVDAIDNYRVKVLLSRAVVRAGVPKVHSSGAGYKGSVTVFLPGGMDYETLFGLPSRGRNIADVEDDEFYNHRKHVVSILGAGMYGNKSMQRVAATGTWETLVVPCMVAGALAAFEALKIAVGAIEHLIAAPRILEFDSLRNTYTIRVFQSVR